MNQILNSVLRSKTTLLLVYLMGMTILSSTALRADIQNHYTEYPSSYFAKKYEVSLAHVYGLANRLGVTCNQRWETEKDGIVADYLANIPVKQIARERGHTHTSVLKKLTSWGIKIRTPTESKMGYDFDTTYFKVIDSHEKAYWLGFIYADGNVYLSESGYKHVFQVALAGADNGHLGKLRAALKDSRPLYPDNGGERYMINNVDFVKDLIALGVTPRKSLTTEFPSSKILPSEYVNSFVLGYFDGDGSISMNEQSWAFTMIGTTPFMMSCQSAMVKHGGLHETKLSLEKRKADGRLSSVVYGGSFYQGKRGGNEHRRKHTLSSLYQYLYANSPVWLDRKHTAFEIALTRIYGHDWKRTTQV